MLMPLVFPHEIELNISAGAIVFALIGAALRTIQEGLGLDQELERTATTVQEPHNCVIASVEARTSRNAST